jgi:hypothetical protein
MKKKIGSTHLYSCTCNYIYSVQRLPIYGLRRLGARGGKRVSRARSARHGERVVARRESSVVLGCGVVGAVVAERAVVRRCGSVDDGKPLETKC